MFHIFKVSWLHSLCWCTTVFPSLTPDSDIYLSEKDIKDLQHRVEHSWCSLFNTSGYKFQPHNTVLMNTMLSFLYTGETFWYFRLSFTVSSEYHEHNMLQYPITDSKSLPATVHCKAHAQVACMPVLPLIEDHLCLRTARRNHFSVATTPAKWAIPFICLVQESLTNSSSSMLFPKVQLAQNNQNDFSKA